MLSVLGQRDSTGTRQRLKSSSSLVVFGFNDKIRRGGIAPSQILLGAFPALFREATGKRGVYGIPRLSRAYVEELAPDERRNKTGSKRRSSRVPFRKGEHAA